MKRSAHFALPVVLVLAGAGFIDSQEPQRPLLSVNVDMVEVTFTVIDGKGKYVHGLRPSDLCIREDGAIQKIVTFAEGRNSAIQLGNVPAESAGNNVFILFDTSSWMYDGFPYALDALAEFVRHLDPADSVAVYKFSRNLFRSVALTTDHGQVIGGIRNTVLGDDTAIYNALLLTLRDAAKVSGRKAIVVFSNGPDNASIVAPDDVRAIAEDEGIPLYVISTREAQRDVISANVFQRLTVGTGGALFWTRTWKDWAEAFTVIREDLASSYTAAYYPAPNANEGFRRINLEIAGDKGKQYRIRTRVGYRPHPHS